MTGHRGPCAAWIGTPPAAGRLRGSHRLARSVLQCPEKLLGRTLRTGGPRRALLSMRASPDAIDGRDGGKEKSDAQAKADLRRHLIGIAALVVTTYSWALNNSGVKYCLKFGMTPGFLTLSRFTVALLPFLASLRVTSFVASAPMSIFAFCGNLSLAYALQSTTAGRVGFYSSVSTCFVPLLQKLVLPKQFQSKILPRQVISVVISLMGMVCMSWRALAVHSPSVKGDALAFTGSLFFAMYTVLLTRTAKTHPIREVSAAMRAWICIFAVGWFLVEQRVWNAGLLPVLRNLIPAAAPGIRGAYAVIGILSLLVAVASFTQVFGQQRVSSTEAAITYSLLPVWSALFGFLFFAERLNGPEQILGGLLIICSSLVAQIPLKIGVKMPGSGSRTGTAPAATAQQSSSDSTSKPPSPFSRFPMHRPTKLPGPPQPYDPDSAI
ncbi:hypothetical protein FVE85_6441 [Porphyridium purpureum]|uniref:EamA domain-containing protein n=1 Tax=Porphyridium purpureum TaxID=35688 RepID=A0A5J4Z581_PORPP|nr:hypothetical protein FVE85_6441 [Porphyridium purpureum]|eukprot:POR9239..scf295_1